jgi:hypothetical protein
VFILTPADGFTNFAAMSYRAMNGSKA